MLRKMGPANRGRGMGRAPAWRYLHWRTFLALLPLAVGCGGIPLAPEVPATFDLNGQWLVREAQSDPPPDLKRLQAEADRRLLELGLPGRRAPMGALAFAVQDFPVLAAKSMIIEQDAHSMGIRYDTGAYRDLSWGERQRGLWQVSAGWLEGALVVVSKAPDAGARETMRLGADGRRLVVEVFLSSAGEDFTIVRTFDRILPQPPRGRP